MNKHTIVEKIEDFAPLDLAENWDCSGWLVKTNKNEVNKVMLALTITDEIINQANANNCDMIISHHPLFYVPLEYKKIDIYCAHTNLDRTNGGTTDTLINVLGLSEYKTGIDNSSFIRYVDCEFSVEDFAKLLSKVSPNLRYVNNKNIENISKIAFCAGSGSEFIREAQENGADAFVTGDLKFHTAVDSEIAVYDIGHFESEILILEVLKKLINGVEVIFSQEKSPFIQKKY